MEITEESSNEDLGNETYDQKFPQIGVNHQAEIPVKVDKLEYDDHSQENSNNLKFMTGLPAIPVIKIVNRDNNNGLVSLSRREEQEGGVGVGVGGGYLLLAPYSASELWNEVDKKSFLLGLYIFGKNIIQLKNFVRTKQIQDIQCYYYGMFYRSQDYLRWSGCPMRRGGGIRKRDCIGEKLFTGVRLQELVSRILALDVSEACKDGVLEVFKQHRQGKRTLQDFFHTLASLVGMSNLVEAVGIGKGKKDLTCILKSCKRRGNQSMPSPEIPDFSTFTSAEIVKYLNGDYRLSKERSSKIFSDGVWPRLETKGWHSTETPKGKVYLIPGIEEFCRMSLVKGNHYFDCVSDVLNKVASDPGLLEENEIDKNEEFEHVQNHQVLEEDDVPNQQIRHSNYLQPQSPTRGTDVMRSFIVVDTSLENGQLHKLMEVRCLSADIFSSFNSITCLKSFNRQVPNASADNAEVQTLKIGNKMQGTPIPQSVPMKRGLEYKVGHGTNKEDSEGVAQGIKRRRWLATCSQGETSNLVTGNSTVQAIVALDVPSNVVRNPSEIPFKPELERPSCGRATHDNVETIVSSNVSLAKNRPCAIMGYAAIASMEPQQTSRRVKNMFDLNLQPDFEPSLIEEETQDHNDNADHLAPNNNASNTYHQTTCSEQPTSQRHSSRNRPPTTRVLEALANGFLTVKTRQRG